MIFAITGLLIACSSDKPIEIEDSDTEDTENPFSCIEDSDCDNGSICENDNCVDGDRNNTPQEAEGLLWGSTADGTLNPSDDIDYYTFNSPAGEHVRIFTVSEYLDDFGDPVLDNLGNPKNNTALVLRDPNGQIVTWSDNYPTGTSVNSKDSVIQAYLHLEGEYLIAVQDINTYYGNSSSGDPGYSYSLVIEEWTQITDEPDDAEDTSVSLDIGTISSWYSVGVVIEEAGDSDWIEVSWDQEVGARIYISGIVNLNGSDLNPMLSIYNMEGDLVSMKENVGPEYGILYPQWSDQGNFLVEVTDANGEGGEDYWTYLYFLISEEGSYPWEVEENNDAFSADLLDLQEKQTNNGNYYVTAQRSGDLSEYGDEDWSSGVNPYEDAWVVVCLNSTKWGSTLSPTIELYDDTMGLVSSVTAEAGENPNAVIEGLQIPEGEFFIRVLNESDSTMEEVDCDILYDDCIGDGIDPLECEEVRDECLSEPQYSPVLSDWYEYVTYVATFEPSSYDCP